MSKAPTPESNYAAWAQLRDLAAQHASPLRTLLAAKGTSADYQLAQMPDGQVGLRCIFQAKRPSTLTTASPWSFFPTEEAALAAFCSKGRLFFEGWRADADASPALRARSERIRTKMLDLLRAEEESFMPKSPAVSRETIAPEATPEPQVLAVLPPEVPTTHGLGLPSLVEWPVGQIEPNPWQPRQEFDESKLQSLGESIREHSLIQPLAGRPKPGDANVVQILDGERRWRAAQRVGITKLHVLVRDISDREMAEAAIEANDQRADMNAIERAGAYQRLVEEFGASLDDIAKRVGRSRPSISNALRLLTLAPEVREMVRDGRLSESHGRALATVSDFPKFQVALATWALEKGWSSKTLEGDYSREVPHWQWKVEGVIKELPAYLEDEFEVCRRCPFKARRSMGYGTEYCLKLDHFAELSASHRARRDAEKAALEALPPDEQKVAKDAEAKAARTKREREKRDAEAAEQARVQVILDRNARLHSSSMRVLNEQRALLLALPGQADVLDCLRPELLMLAGEVVRSWMIRDVREVVEAWELPLDVSNFAQIGTSDAKGLRDRVQGLAKLSTLDLLLLCTAQSLHRSTENRHADGAFARFYLQASGIGDTEAGT